MCPAPGGGPGTSRGTSQTCPRPVKQPPEPLSGGPNPAQPTVSRSSSSTSTPVTAIPRRTPADFGLVPAPTEPEPEQLDEPAPEPVDVEDQDAGQDDGQHDDDSEQLHQPAPQPEPTRPPPMFGPGGVVHQSGP